MFFKELEIPLEDIKKIMDNPNYDKEQALLTQKTLLEQKRNRLDGIIELISDVMKGVNTMSFEAFNDEEVQKILDHVLECMPKESLEEQIQKYGNVENVEHLAENYKKMFRLDNARNILLDLANEYLKFSKLAEATDIQFGTGYSEYVAYAIQKYYGV